MSGTPNAAAQADELAEALAALCDRAAVETLARFRRPMDVENKAGGAAFDPVTEADREAERVIRAGIEARFPDHGIVGEEWGTVRPHSPWTWVIDPIDGTRAFVCGLPSWGTLIGVMHEGTPVAGVLDQPHTGERFLASGGRTRLVHRGETARLATSGCTELSQARLMTTSPFLFDPARIEGYRRVERECRLARYGFDCYAYAMLAAGHADLVVEAGLQPYDIVPLIPLIEGAGGLVTTWSGGPAREGGAILAAATPALHAAAMRRLASA